MTTTENNTLETLLSEDPEGSERDKLLRILKAFEQELDTTLKKGCAPDDYKRMNEVLIGARVAQLVLLDYHRHLNKLG